MSFNDYRIVQKQFEADRILRSGEVVNVSEFRNVRGLEEGRYLRRPISEEDYQLINKAMEGTEYSSVPKRGRPPKNGGDEENGNL